MAHILLVVGIMRSIVITALVLSFGVMAGLACTAPVAPTDTNKKQTDKGEIAAGLSPTTQVFVPLAV